MTHRVVGAGYRFERSIRDEPPLKAGLGVVEQVEQGVGRVGRPGILPDARSLQRDADRDVPDIQGQHHHAVRRARGDGGDWPIRERVGSALPVSEPFSSLFEHPLSHDVAGQDRKSTRLNSSHITISYAVFCLKKKKKKHIKIQTTTKYNLTNNNIHHNHYHT